MCGIAITNKRKIIRTLSNQIDRGMDSLGVITKSDYYKVVGSYYQYKKYIKKRIYRDESDGLCIVHHRKASIGKINMENAHPFIGANFMLMQNGTNRSFFTKYGTKYNVGTDSEALLRHIETKTSTLSEVPALLDQIGREVNDTSGIIIMTDITSGQILFYADGARESYIEIEDGVVEGIFNYNGNSGYKNIGYIIMDFDGNIIETDFDVVNDKVFEKITYAYQSAYDYEYEYNQSKMYSCTPYKRNHNKEMVLFVHNPDDWYALNQENKAEYTAVSNWMMDNIMDLLYSPIHVVLEEYLDHMYGVPNAFEFNRAGYGNFPLAGFRFAYSETFGETRDEDII